MRTVVALGGNTLLEGGEGTAAEQRERVAAAAALVADLTDAGRDVVLTHGNGPQVGALLEQQEAAGGDGMPLDVLVAETQGQVGYMLQQALDGDAASVVTQVTVDPDDPAFDDPSKPVGPFLSADRAAEAPFETREVTRADGTRAHRRVVPSPEPRSVVEVDAVRTLVDAGTTVVAGGGGGVPVVRDGDGLSGVEAVVDKDRTSAVLAAALDAPELLVLTDVDCAYRDFGGPDQRPIGAVDADTLRGYLADGEFGAGSMRPKVEACLRFVESGGDRAVVTSPERALDALDGEAGTRITA